MTKKIKIAFKTVYLEKYFKPYKNPLRIALLLLVFFFFDLSLNYTNSIKPLLTVNILSNKLSHHLMSNDILVN